MVIQLLWSPTYIHRCTLTDSQTRKQSAEQTAEVSEREFELEYYGLIFPLLLTVWMYTSTYLSMPHFRHLKNGGIDFTFSI